MKHLALIAASAFFTIGGIGAAAAADDCIGNPALPCDSQTIREHSDPTTARAYEQGRADQYREGQAAADARAYEAGRADADSQAYNQGRADANVSNADASTQAYNQGRADANANAYDQGRADQANQDRFP